MCDMALKGMIECDLTFLTKRQQKMRIPRVCVWEYYMVILFMPGGYLLVLES
jgi:hypothetical protein